MEKSGDTSAIAYEYAGLRWLAQAEAFGGVAVVPVTSYEEHGEYAILREKTITSASPSLTQLEDFGRALAYTHASGAEYFGCLPPGFSGKAWIGKTHLYSPERPEDTTLGWGEFFARFRIEAYLRDAPFDVTERALISRLAERIASGLWDSPQPALVSEKAHACGLPAAVARLHGDLWNGNVLWSENGAVLIDPAACGGHAETDLAAMALFGFPSFTRVCAAYDEVSPLAEGWQDRIALHQLHLLMVHCVIFGRAYVPDTLQAARAYL